MPRLASSHSSFWFSSRGNWIFSWPEEDSDTRWEVGTKVGVRTWGFVGYVELQQSWVGATGAKGGEGSWLGWRLNGTQKGFSGVEDVTSVQRSQSGSCREDARSLSPVPLIWSQHILPPPAFPSAPQCLLSWPPRSPSSCSAVCLTPQSSLKMGLNPVLLFSPLPQVIHSLFPGQMFIVWLSVRANLEIAGPQVTGMFPGRNPSEA